MRFDDLTKPISGDLPCGEDLVETGDNDFLAYYYDAEAKMPDRYVSLATGERFDPKSIELKSEVKQIEGFLKQTRDLRLLALDARFHILSGRIKGFCEAVIGMANLLEAQWEDVHPQIIDGDTFERQSAIEFLDARAVVVAPMDYATIVIDRRQGEITYRGYLLGTGQVEPREEESVGDGAGMLSALGSPDNAADVENIYGLLTSTADALRRIEAACAANGGAVNVSLDNVKERLDALIAFVVQARSDLAGEASSATPAEDAPETTGDGGDGASETAAAAPTAVASAPAYVGAVSSHAEARVSLAATEAYFRNNEPSTPALILVAQAKQLVGRPLVEALEILIPGGTDGAVIDLGSDTGFKIPMSRMRSLSENAMQSEGAAGDQPTPDPRSVDTREQAMAEIKAVESFYQACEPASPIPVLMFKARSYANRDFQSIVRDLIPVKESD